MSMQSKKLSTYILAACLAVVLLSVPLLSHARGLLGKAIYNAMPTMAAPPVQLPAERSFAACKSHFPGGSLDAIRRYAPASETSELCFNSFAVLYSGRSKTPLVAVERLNRSMLESARGQQRIDQFFVDTRLPITARAELSDYRGSGLQRGHMAGAANQPDAESMAQSFALSNMVPQAAASNEGPWREAEMATRRYAKRATGDVFVFTGPIFGPQPQTIGLRRVWVPTHLFKLVYDANSARAWAYVQENSDQAVMKPPVSYEQFVQWTGHDLLRGLPVSGSSSNVERARR